MFYHSNRNYTTGTYLLECRKQWVCECCHEFIPKGTVVFTRIVCFGPVKTNQHGESYQEKTYTRFHQRCALGLPDLTRQEHDILGGFFKTLTDEEKKSVPQRTFA
jgi:hypothetical protein